jgi:hypothetical protein
MNAALGKLSRQFGVMNPTVAIALITSLSTLAGAAISGYFTLRISRSNSDNQLILANVERAEERSTTKRQIRRDSYVQFLNQVGSVERHLNTAWRDAAPEELTEIPNIVKPVTAELDVLSGLANIVILEGPRKVSLAAQALQARLALESVDLVNVAKESPGKPPCLHDDQRYVSLQMERAKLKSDLIKCAQETLSELIENKSLES